MSVLEFLKRKKPAKSNGEKKEIVTKPTVAKSDPDKSTEQGGLLTAFRRGLRRTRNQLGVGLSHVFLGKKEIDDELLEDIEALLIQADLGLDTTESIINTITEQLNRKQLRDPQALQSVLRSELVNKLQNAEQDWQWPDLDSPYVILMVGVNGAGKTTTIGKLAKHLQHQGKKVMLAAGDTFRAAAVEQLQVWGERNDVAVVAQTTGADSAAVIYDALHAARARGYDVLIADTAGRLHTKSHLMDELKKVARVLQKLDKNAPHEVILVLDATTGQNGLVQAQQFDEALGLNSVIITKLDGTAKGGIVFAIYQTLGVPVRFIGIGESIDDLKPFAAEDYVDAIFDSKGA